MKRRAILSVLFAASGVLPLLLLLGSPPDPTLLVYSLFVLVFFLRPHLLFLARSRIPPAVWFVALLLGMGTIAELLAWSGEYVRASEVPALLHPQLVPDILLGWGFYLPWGIAWLFVCRFYRWNLRQIFLTQGVLGILVEQQGGVFWEGLKSLPVGIIPWIYVGLLYGAIIGVPFVLSGEQLMRRGKRDHWLKYPIILLLVLILIPTVGWVWELAVRALGLVPPPGPIRSRPLW